MMHKGSLEMMKQSLPFTVAFGFGITFTIAAITLSIAFTLATCTTTPLRTTCADIDNEMPRLCQQAGEAFCCRQQTLRAEECPVELCRLAAV